MKSKWEFQELFNFGKKLSNSYELETMLMTITQKIARVLHSYLLQNTPIDTGNLRKMWSAGDNLKFTVKQVNNGYEVTLINEARANHKKGYMYGVAVNDGHKTPGGNGWVMGRFFVERSILQTESGTAIESIVYKELKKWFGRCVS